MALPKPPFERCRRPCMCMYVRVPVICSVLALAPRNFFVHLLSCFRLPIQWTPFLRRSLRLARPLVSVCLFISLLSHPSSPFTLSGTHPSFSFRFSFSTFFLSLPFPAGLLFLFYLERHRCFRAITSLASPPFSAERGVPIQLHPFVLLVFVVTLN